MSEGNWQTASQLEMYPLEWSPFRAHRWPRCWKLTSTGDWCSRAKGSKQGAVGGVLPEREKAAEPRRRARKETTRGREKAVEKEQERRRGRPRERPTRGRTQRRSRAKSSSHRHSGAPPRKEILPKHGFLPPWGTGSTKSASLQSSSPGCLSPA